MKIAFFIAIGFIVGYVVKDLMTKESQVIYHIRRLRAKKGGEITVESEVIVDNKKEKKTKQKPRRLRKNRK